MTKLERIKKLADQIVKNSEAGPDAVEAAAQTISEIVDTMLLDADSVMSTMEELQAMLVDMYPARIDQDQLG